MPQNKLNHPTEDVEEADDGPSLTIGEFCKGEDFSRFFFHRLKKLGLAPETYSVGHLVRITPAARERWRRMMEERTASEVGAREQARREELARAAARLAVQSPRHVANKRRRTTQRDRTGD